MRSYSAVAFLFIVGCSGKSELASKRTYSSSDAAPAAMAISRGAPEVAEDQVATQTNPSSIKTIDSATALSLIIRNGQASVEVRQLDSAIAAVRKLASAVSGYVANSSLQSGENQVRSANLELKIPAVNFDRALSGLQPIGKVEAVNSTAEDVTEEYVDVSARIENAKRLEARLVNLLAERTGKLQDVLDVEKELGRVREEIERYQGRVRYLKTRAAISTLVVNLHEPISVLGNAPGQNVIGESFKSAWRNFVGFVAAFISSLGVLVPLALLGFFGWLAYKRWFTVKRGL